jgi:formylglycine-generating enzyme required for sulfatase activity
MKLFISYRRKTWAFTHLLYQQLGAVIQDDIFMDLEGVDQADFEKSILGHLHTSHVVLLVVTELTFADRIHNDADWVRREIREALQRNIPIVLISVENQLPPHGLPDDIKDVARSQAVMFYPDYFSPAIDRLADFLVKMRVATRRQIASQSQSSAPDAKPISGRNTMGEALDLLEAGELDKGIFLLEELLKGGYKSNNFDLASILNQARSQRDILTRERTAQYDYDEIVELVKRKFTEQAGLEAFQKWCKAYPDFIEKLDVAKLQARIQERDSLASEELFNEVFGEVFNNKQRTLPSKDTEATRLLSELDYINTAHLRRLEIGERLAQIGDPRAGIGVLPNGVPDISWCFVEKGGQITIEKTNFTIKPFYVAKYLTTNAQYQAFVDAKDGYNNPEWWKLFPKDYRPQKLAEPRNPNSNAPRDTISWYQSMAFAMWLDHQYRQNGLFQSVLNSNSAYWKISLPPEWYWQWMAQNGNERHKYAWGKLDNIPNTPRANTGESGIKQITAVGMYPQGVAGCGAYDVIGNLWEWCLNDFSNISKLNGYSTDSSKSLRGGSFNNFQSNVSVVSRKYNNPYYDINLYGCRLVIIAARI